ncbi:PQQ-binding-like beta-propeller repeat protein [Streptomyces sp. NPDC003247]|uniref:outer membrane protein assembly factor BamB family protein n=1 Tax=Streptomyces sp. NPDC003247 TaxID=3364677 RepID=UPI0036CE8618
MAVADDAGADAGVGVGVVGVMDAVEAAAKAEPTPGGAAGPRPSEANGVPPGRAVPLRGTLAVAVCLALAGVLLTLWPGEEAEQGPARGTPAAGERDPEARTPSASGRSAKATVAWQVPATGGRYDEGPGAWGLGDVVVRGRTDGLFAYGVRDGDVHWTVPAPAGEAVCAMSPRAEQGVGLVAYGEGDGPCATLVAVRTSDGHVLWRRSVTGAGLVAGGLAVGGATAVTAQEGVVRAGSAETGEQRWRRVLAGDCEVRAVDATDTRTLLVEQCGAVARLVALDTRTGGERWSRRLPIDSPATAAVVSVTPVVVAVSEENHRGTRALFGFDGGGTPTVTVPLSGPAGELVAPRGIWAGTGSESRPLVLGDLLVTLAERDERVPDVVVAHSLKDGHQVWEYTADPLAFYGLAREPDGRIGVLADDGGALVILLDDAGTERGRVETDAAEDAALSIRPELIPVTGGHIVVNHMSMRREPGIFALR